MLKFGLTLCFVGQESLNGYSRAFPNCFVQQ